MIARCTQPSNPAYAHYKKRGITVCDRWRVFENFLADLGPKPGGKREFTLERIKNEGNYEPGNCEWAPWKIQGNNRSTNVRFEYLGQSYTMAELVRVTGVSKEVLRSRLCRSDKPWTVEGAVTTPKLPKRSRFFC